jgi:hypothetical protein
MKKQHMIFLNILAIIILLIGMNMVYKTFFLEKDLQTHSDIINLTRKVVSDSCDMVYIGESSNIAFVWEENDHRTISDMIAACLPDHKVGNISKGALHAGIYYELLRHIPETAPVKTVIVTMNLRSFDVDWIYSDLETPLQESIVLLKNRPALYNRFLLSFKGYDERTNTERSKQRDKHEKTPLHFPYDFPYHNAPEWRKAQSQLYIINPDTASQINLTNLSCTYISIYAFQIDTLTNPRIKDFNKIVALAKQRGWHLYFNLLAENTEQAQQLAGNDLLFLMRQNKDLLVKYYEKQGVTVIDNLEAVPDSAFIDRNWTTEHYTQQGRSIIAKRVSEKLLHNNLSPK